MMASGSRRPAEVPDYARTQTFGPAAFDIVLEAYVRPAVQHGPRAEFLVDPNAAMPLRVSTVEGPRVVRLDDALIGAGDIAARRIEAVRQIVEWDGVAPLILGVGGITETVRDPAASRHPAGHLVTDVTIAIGVTRN